MGRKNNHWAASISHGKRGIEFRVLIMVSPPLMIGRPGGYNERGSRTMTKIKADNFLLAFEIQGPCKACSTVFIYKSKV